MAPATRPTAPPGVLYRAIRLICGAVSRALFRVEVVGRENLPRGAAIVAGLPHRNWVEPLLLVAIMPARPRLVIVAEEATALGSWWRRLLVGLAGGVIPIGRGRSAAGFEAIARAAENAIGAGAVLAIFPEVGQPARAPSLRRLSPGVCHLAARTRTPVLPIVFGGTHELYLRRRIVVRILPPLPPSTSTGRDSIAEFMAEFGGLVQAAAVEAHESAEAGPPRRKRWRWLTGNYPRAD